MNCKLSLSLRKLLPLLIFNITCFYASAQAQEVKMPDSTRKLLDTVFNIIHSESLNRDSINWDTLKKEVYQKAINAKKVTDIIPAVRCMFDQLHDNHSAIVYKGVQYGEHKPRQQFSKELLAQINAIGLPKLKVKILDNNYGYVLIPSI